MLAKKFRLPGSAWLLKQKSKPLRVVISPLFTLRVYDSTISYPRVGVAISAKVDKRATARNHIKRIIYNMCKMHIDMLKNKDYCFFIRPQMRDSQPEDISNEIIKIIESL